MNRILMKISFVVLLSISLNVMALDDWWFLNARDYQCRIAKGIFQPSKVLAVEGCNTESFKKNQGILTIRCQGKLNKSFFYSRTFEHCYEMKKALIEVMNKR
jgi:hypothetical protein